MIGGRVDDELVARISLSVLGASDITTVDVIVDTGFTGTLTLRQRSIEELGLEFYDIAQAILGDGSTTWFLVYTGLLDWNGSVVTIRVDSAETDPLVGMALLEGHALRIACVPGGEITIERLP